MSKLCDNCHGQGEFKEGWCGICGGIGTMSIKRPTKIVKQSVNTILGGQAEGYNKAYDEWEEYLKQEDSYACPVCGAWVLKNSGHVHMSYIMGCEHDYIPYPLPYISTDARTKMMCRKCLHISYINQF